MSSSTNFNKTLKLLFDEFVEKIKLEKSGATYKITINSDTDIITPETVTPDNVSDYTFEYVFSDSEANQISYNLSTIINDYRSVTDVKKKERDRYKKIYANNINSIIEKILGSSFIDDEKNIVKQKIKLKHNFQAKIDKISAGDKGILFKLAGSKTFNSNNNMESTISVYHDPPSKEEKKDKGVVIDPEEDSDEDPIEPEAQREKDFDQAQTEISFDQTIGPSDSASFATKLERVVTSTGKAKTEALAELKKEEIKKISMGNIILTPDKIYTVLNAILGIDVRNTGGSEIKQRINDLRRGDRVILHKLLNANLSNIGNSNDLIEIYKIFKKPISDLLIHPGMIIDEIQYSNDGWKFPTVNRPNIGKRFKKF